MDPVHTDNPTHDPADVLNRLQVARDELWERAGRSPLLDAPRGLEHRTVEVVDTRAEDLFRTLVVEGHGVLFRPEGGPGDRDPDRLAPGRPLIGTRMPPAPLQQRLRRMAYDARCHGEEQGVHALFLAMGFLAWRPKTDGARVHHAPLILIPVTLQRESAQHPFHIEYTGEDLATNHLLRARLRGDHWVELPELEGRAPFPGSATPVQDYMEDVQAAVAGQDGWGVLAGDAVLSLFPPSDFHMARDLDPAAWPEPTDLLENPVLASLLGAGFEADADVFDDVVGPGSADMVLDGADARCVLDADSSQALAIEQARQGYDLAILAPPGTGASRTIANIAAAAVRDEKKILVVAEKAAALRGVRHSLEEAGLGAVCLELYGPTVRKAEVVEDLSRTLSEEPAPPSSGNGGLRRLADLRGLLNFHAQRMSYPHSISGLTAYQILGWLARLTAKGVEGEDFVLPAAREWGPEFVSHATDHVARLAKQVGRMGLPAGHPWRGVGLGALSPHDRVRILAQAEALYDDLSDWERRVRRLAEHLGVPCRGLGDVPYLTALARHVLDAPPVDLEALRSPAWSEPSQVEELVRNGQFLEVARDRVDPVLAPAAWQRDLSEVRLALRTHGESSFRALNGRHRQALATLRELAHDRLPKSLSERLRLLDVLADGQKAQGFLTAHDDLGQEAFGRHWHGTDSEWSHLDAVARWVSSALSPLTAHVPAVLGRIRDRAGLDALTRDVEEAAEPLRTRLEELFEGLEVDVFEAWGEASLESVPLKALTDTLRAWLTWPDRAQEWIAYRRWDKELQELGLEEVADRLADGRLEADRAVDAFHATYLEELSRQLFEELPELADFRGVGQEEIQAEFAALDLAQGEVARAAVAARHRDGLPVNGVAGEVGIVRRAIAKEDGHLSLGDLLHQAGRAVQAIKPVFLASPSTVARYLPAGHLTFDLVVVDDAGRTPAAAALGAVARGRQLVVVGDRTQLPPEGAAESILDRCLAQGMERRSLRWHYRSRHDSLIAVSNREVYEDGLRVPPGPTGPSMSPGLGLHVHRVDGVWQPSSGTNPVEAAAVVDAVIRHAQETPELSLGVGTLSVAQRDAVLDALELRRHEHPETEPFFRDDEGRESFFVKHHEHVQRDERDVFLVSVGYGPDQSLSLERGLDSLSRDGGARALNLLLTRARSRCDVFASMTAADIEVGQSPGSGLALLRSVLHFGETGRLEPDRVPGTPSVPVFESEVAKALRQHGLEVDHFRGPAGFFVDMAVRDPDRPDRYVLGLQCDGPSYGSALSARDRDRLRRKLLEDRGWRVQPVWSVDWFQDPERACGRVLEAVETARLDRAESDSVDNVPAETGGEPDAWGRPVGSHPGGSGSGVAPAATLELPKSLEAEPYQEASFRVGLACEPYDAPPGELVAIVSRIVETEGPIHMDEVVRRLATVWGSEEPGTRTREAARWALQQAEREGRMEREGRFVWSRRGLNFRPRSRRHVQSPTLRSPSMIPPLEIRLGLSRVVEGHVGLPPGEASELLSRILGFDQLGDELSKAVRRQIDKMVDGEELRLRDGKLYVA